MRPGLHCCPLVGPSALPRPLQRLNVFSVSILCVPRFHSPQQGIDSDSLGNCYPVCTCAQSCPTLCNPMECSPPVSSVHGISQGRILEWVAISFSRISSRPRDQTQVSCIADGFFTTREVIVTLLGEKKNLFLVSPSILKN